MKRIVAGRRSVVAGLAATLGTALAGCAGLPFTAPAPQPSAPQEPETAVGTGQVRVGLILPMSASGNAGPVAQAMRNAAELALSEFQAPDIQLLVRDDGGNPFGAQSAAQGALDEGAEIILGPLFAATVAPVGQTTRMRNVPVIAFSTDSTVATRGVYLLSFLPEGDVDRVIDYAASRNRNSFAALIPDNAYGNVVDGAFRQAAARNRGRVVAVERVGNDPAQIADAARRIAGSLPQANALFIPGDGDTVPRIAQALAAAGVDMGRLQLLGTGLWDDPRIHAEASLQGGWFAAPDNAGYRAFSERYRARYGQDPLRAASLAYDAVSLTAALVRTQGADRFNERVLTNPSGFSGIDGVFRFRPEGTSERGLAVMRVARSGAQTVSAAPRAFPDSGT